MKRGTEHLLKFKLLSRRLGLEPWQTKGLLQSIWDFTAENCPRGDIGRYAPELVAVGIGYGGDAGALWAALTERPEGSGGSGWIDAHEEFGWVIHDWSDHCENSVHAALARRGQRFVDGKMPNLSALGGSERKRVEGLWKEEEAALRAAPPGSSLTPPLSRGEREQANHGQDARAPGEGDSPALAEPRLGQSPETRLGQSRPHGVTVGVPIGDPDPAEPEPNQTKPNPAEPKAKDLEDGVRMGNVIPFDRPSAELRSGEEAARSAAPPGGKGQSLITGRMPVPLGRVLRDACVVVAPGEASAEERERRRQRWLNGVLRRVMGATRDGAAWRAWWIEVIRVLERTQDGISELESLCEYAERAADPARRVSDGRGPLARPGAWMTGELLRWARSRGVVLPALPGKGG